MGQEGNSCIGNLFGTTLKSPFDYVRIARFMTQLTRGNFLQLYSPGMPRMISGVCDHGHRGWQGEPRGNWGGDEIWSISTRAQQPLCPSERGTSRTAQDTENSPASFVGKEYPDHSPILHHQSWCSLARGQRSLVYLSLGAVLLSEWCPDALALFLPPISAVYPLNCYFFYWLEKQYLPLWREGGCKEKISSICDMLRE